MPEAKARELRRLDDADLAKEIEESHRRLFTLRMQAATQQLTNHRQVVNARRHIARLKTIQRERELGRVFAAGQQKGRP